MQERKDFYIYGYFDQRKQGNWSFKNMRFEYQPFYFGRGVNNRIKIHTTPSSLVKKSMKNSYIKSIIKDIGELPINFKIFENLTLEEANDIEKELIRFFGRRDLKTGILTNCTNGGDGSSFLSKEVKNSIKDKVSKTVFQYSLEGEFVKEWSCISDTIEIINNPSNISNAIKRGGTCGGFIWSYELLKTPPKRIRYQMPIKYTNIQQLDKNNKLIQIHKNMSSVKLTLDRTVVTKVYECINNKINTAYGFKWKVHSSSNKDEGVL